MSVLEQQLRRTLTLGMVIPEPMRQLFDWIEDNGFFDEVDGRRVGYLFPQDRLVAESTEMERPGGTEISFYAEGNTHMESWLGTEDPAVLSRLCGFAQTGAEGSMAAFWLDEHGEQKIVHLGSGSGSVMVCVLAEDPVDFLRLLAIGYDEICWPSEFVAPPNTDLAHGVVVHPNRAFQRWVTETFGVSIPRVGLDVVRHPAEMTDADSPDPFHRWVTNCDGARS